MKRMAEFTPHQLETWLAVLGTFKVEHVNRAVVEFGLNTDPFPDLGKIVMKCQGYAQSSDYAPGRDANKVSNKTVANAAKALGLKIR